MEFIIFISVIISCLWVVHGNTEAQRVKLQNLAIKQDKSEALKRSENTKRLIQVQQAMLCLIIALFIATDSVIAAGGFLLYCLGSRWFIFELFYGHYHLNDWLYIGSGGKFDNEITSNRLLYFFIRLTAWAISGLLFYLSLYL